MLCSGKWNRVTIYLGITLLKNRQKRPSKVGNTLTSCYSNVMLPDGSATIAFGFRGGGERPTFNSIILHQSYYNPIMFSTAITRDNHVINNYWSSICIAFYWINMSLNRVRNSFLRRRYFWLVRRSSKGVTNFAVTWLYLPYYSDCRGSIVVTLRYQWTIVLQKQFVFFFWLR